MFFFLLLQRIFFVFTKISFTKGLNKVLTSIDYFTVDLYTCTRRYVDLEYVYV